MPTEPLHTAVDGLKAIALDEVRFHKKRLFGMGLFWAWLQLVFSLFFPGLDRVSSWLSSADVIWSGSLLCSLIAYIVILVCAKRILSAQSGKILFWPSHVSLMVGALALLVASQGLFSQVFILVGILFTGFGSAVVFVIWGEHLARLKCRRVLFDMAVYSVFTAIFFAIGTLIEPILAQIFVVLLPGLSGLLLYLANRDEPAVGTSGIESQVKAAKLLHREFLGYEPATSLLALAVLIGLTYGIMQASASELTKVSVVTLTWVTVLGIATSGVLLFITAIGYRKENQLFLIGQVSLPLLALGFLLMPFFTDELPLHALIYTAGHSYFYSLLWIFYVDLSNKRKDILPLSIFALGQLSFLGSSFLAFVASSLLFVLFAPSTYIVTIVSLVTVYILMLTLLIVIRHYRHREGAVPVIDDEVMADCLKVIAKSAELTPREDEVFRLIFEGADRAAIRETLVVSNNTVKAHARHIYRKLAVRSQEELVALVNDAYQRSQKGL